MPRVKVDYIVSFSSEDPDNQASNLLAWEVSKRKWLCGKEEMTGSIVLQLTHAVQISAIHVGAHHAALVEVLVGRSEKPNEEFQVLVPSSVFLSPAECRRPQAAERVRSFSGAQLAEPARAQRWDRVRVVCSQPYNRHCKYGLSFVHIYEAGAEPAAVPSATAVPSRLLALDAISSDEDEFKPGELFAEHMQISPDNLTSAGDTGAQIRQATSQALKNISESYTKLMKTPISKTLSERQTDRHRDSPPDNADRGLHTHSRHKQREANKKHDKLDKLNRSVYPDKRNLNTDTDVTLKKQQETNKRSAKTDVSNSVHAERRDLKTVDGHNSSRASKPALRNDQIPVANDNNKQNRDCRSSCSVTDSIKNKNHSFTRDENESRKRRRSDGERETKAATGAEPHSLLRGAVLVLSGYRNPRRAHLRRLAEAMGARVLPDWTAAATHLICAFPNTPKLRAARAACGRRLRAARAEWLEQCSRRRALLPWRRFATEPQDAEPQDAEPQDAEPQEAEPQEAEPDDADSDDAGPDDAEPGEEPDCDTDEEIEKVIGDRKRAKTCDSPPAARGSADEYSAETDEESPADEELAAPAGALPDFYDGRTFLIEEDATDARFDVRLLSRYVRAYGGVVLDPAAPGSRPDFVLRSHAHRDGTALRPDWVWHCHAARRLLPAARFALT